ncbi:enoyl-CoA hydratase/isomerase family protein [Chloroflexota bacterium]
MVYVNYEKKGQIVIVTMNRPERLNALGQQLTDELARAWQELESDEEARVGILTGVGRAFSAGVDLKERSAGLDDFSKYAPGVPRPWSPRCQSKPVIAAVNGITLGAGFDIIMMDADICIAAESATFGMPEILHAQFSLGTPWVIHNLPKFIIMEIILLGENITAQRAYELGLANKVVPDAVLMPTAVAFAEKLAKLSSASVQGMRQNILKATELTKEAYELEFRVREDVTRGDVAVKGAKAFSERKHTK